MTSDLTFESGCAYRTNYTQDGRNSVRSYRSPT